MTIATYIFSIKESKIAFKYNSIFNIVSTVSFFLFFKNIYFESKLVNNLAKYTFGTYVIHVNTFIVPILWNEILHTNLFHKSKYFILHLIGSIVIVYVICIILDFIRDKIFEKILNKFLNKTKSYNYEIKVD